MIPGHSWRRALRVRIGPSLVQHQGFSARAPTDVNGCIILAQKASCTTGRRQACCDACPCKGIMGCSCSRGLQSQDCIVPTMGFPLCTYPMPNAAALDILLQGPQIPSHAAHWMTSSAHTEWMGLCRPVKPRHHKPSTPYFSRPVLLRVAQRLHLQEDLHPAQHVTSGSALQLTANRAMACMISCPLLGEPHSA